MTDASYTGNPNMLDGDGNATYSKALVPDPPLLLVQESWDAIADAGGLVASGLSDEGFKTLPQTTDQAQIALDFLNA
jgi:hypothetical protein